MNRRTHAFRLFFILCLAALLAACGGAPSRETGATSPPPTATPPDATATAVATATAPAAVPAEATTATSSPTPTAGPLVQPATPSPEVASRCPGLGGGLELQVLVGPAEAVGLEPVAVGEVPFSVTTEQAPYLVAGQAPITYEAMLEEKWGTYTVNMDLQMSVSGECQGESGSELLDLVLDMSGEQFVEVDSEGFHGEYPWSGSHSLEVSLPLVESASAQGEGWLVILHLGSP